MSQNKVNLKIDWATHESAKYACEKWHYSKKMPAGSQNKIGVWENGVFVGVILFGRPSFPSIGKPYNLDQTQVVELVRVALNKHTTPVTKMISYSFKLLKQKNPGLVAVVSFADKNQGHHGGIYQGGNWIYVGEGGAGIQYKYKGVDVHQRNLTHKFGKNFAKHPDVVKYKPEPKYKYIYVLNNEYKEYFKKLSKPYPKRVGSVESSTSEHHSERGGESPTSTLQLQGKDNN